jgi:hypothetical protein
MLDRGHGEIKVELPLSDNPLSSVFGQAMPVVIAGSDPRLESEIETGRDEGLHFSAPAGGSRLAVYGPYASLPAGRYRIELRFVVVERAPGDVEVELCQELGERCLYRRRCFGWELRDGLIRVSYPFDESVGDLEVRLRVPANFAGVIRELTIVPC